MNSANWQNPEYVVLWENTPEYRELMRSYAEVGLDDHNKRDGTNLVLLDFLRATDFPGASGRITDLQIHVYDPRSQIEKDIDVMVWTGNEIEIGIKLNDRPNHQPNASSSSLIGGKDEDLNVPYHVSYELGIKQGDPNLKPEHVVVEATYLHNEDEGARAGYVRYYTHHLKVNVDGHIWYATALQRSWLLPVHEDSANSFRLPPEYPPLEPKDADDLQPMNNSQMSRYFEIAAAWFAVALYNFKTHNTLAFHGISSGKSKTCCMGEYYYLTLDVSHHGRPGTLTTSLRFDGPVFEATSLYRPHD